MSNEAFSCSCYTGTAIVGVDGNGNPTCGCSTDPLPSMPVEVYHKTGQRPPQTVNNYYVVGAQTAEPDPDPNADGTIFGLSPLVAIGLAVGGIWLLSSMSEGK